MDPQLSLLILLIARLPARFAFDEIRLRDALRFIDSEGEPRFAFVTPELLHDALVAAADAGLVREVEIASGQFLIVRTDLVSEGLADVPAHIDRRLRSGELNISQPDRDRLGHALEVPVETVALRRAVLSATSFVWSPDDYAALLEATQWHSQAR